MPLLCKSEHRTRQEMGTFHLSQAQPSWLNEKSRKMKAKIIRVCYRMTFTFIVSLLPGGVGVTLTIKLTAAGQWAQRTRERKGLGPHQRMASFPCTATLHHRPHMDLRCPVMGAFPAQPDTGLPESGCLLWAGPFVHRVAILTAWLCNNPHNCDG